jgi:hypothetical protein
MTIIFTAVTPSMIVMTADSAVTLFFQDRREYEEGTKLYAFPGIGSLATWGARDGNQLGMWLREHVREGHHPIDALAGSVYYYLSHVYQPGERDADDVGYHIAGFVDGRPRLFHAFYGFDRPRPANQTERAYKLYDHSPGGRGVEMLYNGRNDLADTVVANLLAQIRQGGDVRYDIQNPVGLIQFCDFVARFAAELTPEVGPPITTVIISHRNQIARLVNESFVPLQSEQIRLKLDELANDPTTGPLNLRLEVEGCLIPDNVYVTSSGIAPPGWSSRNNPSDDQEDPTGDSESLQ